MLPLSFYQLKCWVILSNIAEVAQNRDPLSISENMKSSNMNRLIAMMSHLARRDDSSVKLPVVSLVCIIVGAAVGLTLATLAVVFLVRTILKKRHNRAMADIEKKGTGRQAAVFHDKAATVSSPHLRTKNPQKELRVWKSRASDEDQYRRRGEQWEKEIPYPRLEMYDKKTRLKTRHSQRASKPKNFRRSQLSAVIESPRSQTFDIPSPDAKALAQAPKKTWSPFNRRKESSQQSKHVSPPAFEPWPLLVGQPPNPRERGDARRSGRSQSAPTVTAEQLPKDAILGYNGPWPTAHLRSWSVESRYPSMAPTKPPPPLPAAAPVDMLRQQNLKGAKRPISNESLASSHSTSSSIIGNASHSKSRAADFNLRHPEMGLGAQKRAYDDQLKTSLIGDAKYYSPDDVGKAITTGSTTAVDPFESASVTKAPTVRNEDSAVALSDRYIHDGELRRDSAMPKHHWRHNRGSETGSPTSRKRHLIGLVLDQNSNDAHLAETKDGYAAQSMPRQDADALDDGSLSHKRVDSVAKPSAMKGSPSAKRSHRRQNCVRIEINPTVLGPESGSEKTWNVEEMAEGMDIGLAGLGAPKWATASNFGSPEYPMDVPNFSLRRAPTETKNTIDALEEEGSLSVPDFPSPGITPRNSTTWTGSKWGQDSDWEYDLNVHNASRQTNDLQVVSNGLLGTSKNEKQVLEPRDNSLDSASFHTPPSDAGMQQTEALPMYSASHTTTLGETTPDSIPNVNRLSATPTFSRMDRPNISPPQSPSFSYPLTHQRQQATQDLMGSIKALRRMNSEIMDDPLECREGRRYLGLGADTRANSDSLLMPMDAASQFNELIRGENEGPDDSLNPFWTRDSVLNSPGLVETLQEGGKRYSQSTLYDEDGFLKVAPL